jgi:outer membrane receptor for ferrienterochelin and colicins
MMDLTVSKRLLQGSLFLSVGARNLMNVTNIGFENSNGGVHSAGGMSPVSWGRTFFVSLKYQLDKSLK